MLPDEEGMRVSLVAVKAGMPPAVSAQLARVLSVPVTITIPSGIPIKGIVLGSDKKPIADVDVEPIIAAGQQVPDLNGASESWATTDSEGRFTGRLTTNIEGLAFHKQGYMWLQQPIDMRSLRLIEAILAQASSIAGHVMNKDGSPAAEVRVLAGERIVITGTDGSFSLDEVEPGPQVIRFGRLAMQQQSITAPARDVVLILPPMRSIRGRVIDASTSAPVEKFTVMAGGLNDFELPTSVESGAGEFKIEVSEGSAKLTVSAPGYASATDVSVATTNKEPVVIQLSRGRSVRGRVVDANRQPIAGVSVRYDGDSYDNEARQTAADGSFEITGGRLIEPARIVFQKDDYVTVERRVEPKNEETALKIVLRHGLKFSGRVVDRAGAGVPNVSVSAQSAAHGARSEDVQTDASGAFHFSSLAPARYDFTAQPMSGGARGAARDVDIEKVHEITILLENHPTATIFGHVSGVEGSSRGQFVNATTTDGESQMGSIDVAGNYRIENAPTGTVEVQARMYGSRGSRSSKKVVIDVTEGSETRADLAFGTAVVVQGRVTRANGPVAGVTVTFYGPSNANVITGPDGEYEAKLDPGEYDVSIVAADSKPLPFSEHVIVNGAAEINLRIDTAVISTAVIDVESGQPIAGATVSASRHGETHTLSSSITAADGTASLDVTRRERMTITASKDSYANASQDVTPSDNQSVALRLLRSPGAIVRIVDVRDGRTLSGYVIARDQSGRVLASANEPEADGTVTLALPPGRYTFSASAEGFGSHTVKTEVPSGEIRIPLTRGGSLTIRSNNDLRATARLIQPDGEEYVRCWCSGIAEIKIDSRMTLVDRIAPGPYTLEVLPSGGKAKRFPVSVVEGQTTIVPIE